VRLTNDKRNYTSTGPQSGLDMGFDDFIDETRYEERDFLRNYVSDQYLSLMKRSDEALEYLIRYFESSDEPTMIVMFGDHQPSVEDEFFDEIAGMPSADVPAGDHLMWYETPFLIWKNYESGSEQKGKMSAIYLASELLDQAGLDMTPYQRFLLSIPGYHKGLRVSHLQPQLRSEEI